MEEASPLSPLRVRLLGGFEVRLGSRLIDERSWPLRKARSLVKLLALAERHRLPWERVVDVLWPELDPVAARNNLRQALHVARLVLASPPGEEHRYLVRRNGDLALSACDPAWIDVDAFESEARRAREFGDPAALTRALGLYEGPLLPDAPYEEWVIPRREALHRTYLELLGELALAQEHRGELRAAIETLERLVRDEPTCEPAHRSLMRLHAVTGERHLALRQYGQLQQAMHDLGVEPSPASNALHDAIASGRIPDLGASEHPRDDLSPR